VVQVPDRFDAVGVALRHVLETMLATLRILRAGAGRQAGSANGNSFE
jgi:hypothetical protein